MSNSRAVLPKGVDSTGLREEPKRTSQHEVFLNRASVPPGTDDFAPGGFPAKELRNFATLRHAEGADGNAMAATAGARGGEAAEEFTARDLMYMRSSPKHSSVLQQKKFNSPHLAPAELEEDGEEEGEGRGRQFRLTEQDQARLGTQRLSPIGSKNEGTNKQTIPLHTTD